MNDPALSLLVTVSRSRPVAGGWLVLASRLAIAATCLHWALEDARLESVVGVCALALTWLPSAIIRDDALRGPTQSLTAILLAAHVVLGMALAFYEHSAVYDKWVHLGAFAAIGALTLATVARYCARCRLAASAPFVQLIVLTFALSLGTCWELFEFAIDQTGWFRAQRGLHDTMLDLLADLSGVLLVLGLYTAWLRFRWDPGVNMSGSNPGHPSNSAD